MIIYCPSYVHFQGLYAAGTAARDSKSRENVHLKTVLADPAMCTDLPMTFGKIPRMDHSLLQKTYSDPDRDAGAGVGDGRGSGRLVRG